MFNIALALFATALAVPEPSAPPVASDDSLSLNKGLRLRSDDGLNVFKINGRVQARYSYEARDPKRDRKSFSIPRARLKLSGMTLTPGLSFELQVDLGEGFASLKDAYVDYRLLPKALYVRAGQWKRPFSRQRITSSGKLELVDRAMTDKDFASGRDIGVMLHNGYERSPSVEWAVGIFNGTGDKGRFVGRAKVDPDTGKMPVKGSFSNVPRQFEPMVVGRVGLNRGGIDGYSEADLEGGGLRYGVGASVLATFDQDNTDDATTQGEVDFIVKLHGMSLSGGAYVAAEQIGKTFRAQELAAFGGHTQAGYVFDEWVQLALRYSAVDTTSEYVAGVSLFSVGHRLKWQTDGGATVNPGSPTELFVRSQVQLSF